MSGADDRITFRRATEADLPAVVEIITEGNRAGVAALTLDAAERQFRQMQDAETNVLYVAEHSDQIVATYQMGLITGLSATASVRAQVETVRVRASYRGAGLGSRLMQDAEQRATRAGAQLIQLTSSVTREDAHRFYSRLGYVASHAGFKKSLLPVED